jgi:putative transposase
MKYQPEFPDRFGSFEDVHSFCQGLFIWYNREHRHSGIGCLTLEMVHYRYAEDVINARCSVLLAADNSRPKRFVKRMPESALIKKPQGTESGREV